MAVYGYPGKPVLTVRVPEAMLNDLKAAAEISGMTVSQILRSLIASYLK